MNTEATKCAWMYIAAAALSAAVTGAMAADGAAIADSGRGTGFYRVENIGGDRWRVLDPQGRPFVPIAVDHCRLWGEGYFEKKMLERFGTKESWAEDAFAKLKDWNFTLLGACSDPALFHKGMPHAIYPWVGEPFSFDGGDRAIITGKRRPGTAFPNVFNPEWPQYCHDLTRRNFAPQRNDPDLFGWFFDNELAWWGADVKDAARPGQYGLVDAVAALPPEHTARQAWDAFQAAHGKEWPQSKVRSEFLRLIAEKYFGAIVPAIRAADPNHLILGCRFSGVWMEPELVETAGKWLDAVSFNHYSWVDVTNGEVRVSYREGATSGLAAQRYRELYALAGKPLLVTEWSFPAKDVPRIPSVWGEGMKMPTQAERVIASEIFARELMAQPFILGYSYFMWHDSAGGGENSNYGLVGNDGNPYEALAAMFRRIHAEFLDKDGEHPMPSGVSNDKEQPSEFINLERVDYLEGGGKVWCFANRGTGQMLSTVFVSPEGKVLVVDGGHYPDGDHLRRFLASIGGRVDYWFLTHAHPDHFGALVQMHEGKDAPVLDIRELIFNFPDRAWMEENEKGCATHLARFFDGFLEVPGTAIPRGDCRPGRKVAFGSWSFEILNPPALCEVRGPLNNSSVCLTVNAGGKRWLVTGDIAWDAQRALLPLLKGREKHDAVFMAHHGQMGTTKDFYAAIAPEIAVWPTPRWLWDNRLGKGTVGSGPFETNYTKCWLQELGVKRQYVLDHDVVFE